MALKAILESIDELPEDVKKEYVPKKIGDKDVFVLDVEGVQAHPSVTALKTAHDKTRGELKTVRDEKKSLEDKLRDVPDDFTLDEWNRLNSLEGDEEAKKRAKEAADKRFADQRKAYEDRVKNVESDRDAKLAEKDKLIKSVNEKRVEDKADALLTDSLTKAGVKPELLKAAKLMHRANVGHEIDEETQDIRLFIKGNMGEEEIDNFVSSWSKSDEGKAFVAPISGSGADTNRTRRDANDGENPYTAAAWNRTKQGLLEKSDHVKAERLAKAAGFASLELANKAVRAIQPPKA